MDVACSGEPVPDVNVEDDKVMEVLSNEGQLASCIKTDVIVHENAAEDTVSANIAKAAAASSPMEHCDLNSNFQQHTKTKGTIRQQLRQKRLRISGKVHVPTGEKSDDKSAIISAKKITSPDRPSAQVTCLFAVRSGDQGMWQNLRSLLRLADRILALICQSYFVCSFCEPCMK